MNTRPSPSGHETSIAVDRQIDQVCNRFEAACKVGPPPPIEPFLEGWPGADRSALLRELVLLDEHYRHKKGHPSSASDYQVRFPEFDPSWFQEDASLDTPTSEFSPASTPTRSFVQAEETPPAGEVSGQARPHALRDYQLLEEIGHGGMGVVYKAREIKLERTVALKMIRTGPGGLPSASALERFHSEARAVARLKHPNIVPIYAWGEHEGQPFFVMEYLEGGSLTKKLDRSPWTPRQSAELVATLAGAVHHAHQRGILHRDLKPANVLLDEKGQPYLSDFGLARDLHAGSATCPGAVLGTPEFMSPEQAQGQTETLGPATDVFGLGAILYRLLTGRPPYQGADSYDVVTQASQTKFTPLRQVNPRIPAGLARICEKALAADPQQRHASALALEQDLRRWLAWRRRLPLGAAVSAVAGMLVLLVLFLPGMLTRHSRPGDSLPGEGGKLDVLGAEPLTGDLDVLIWTPGGAKKGWKVQEMMGGAVPVLNGEWVHLKARLNRPAHVYLIWVDSEGVPTPIYPWNRGKELKITDLAVAPPVTNAEQIVDSPGELARGWEMQGPSGLETILLLARQDPLPATVNLAEVLGKLKPAPLVDPREVVVRGFDRDRPIKEENIFRRPGQQAVEIDDSLLQMMGRLQPHFEMIRAVRFAHAAKP
jgi:predicted Ser/Thr protein kinase